MIESPSVQCKAQPDAYLTLDTDILVRDVTYALRMQRAEAVMMPAPSAGMVRCYIKRVKNFFGSHASFQMHLEDGEVFLLAARRRKKSKTSSYIISQDIEDLKRDTDNCLAKASIFRSPD